MTGTMIGIGATAEIFEQKDGRVLKLFRKHIPKSLSEREYNSTRIIAGCGIRVPEALDTVERDGRCGIVFERIHGQSMMKKMLNPLSIVKYSKMLAALQYRLHQETPEGLPAYKKLIEENIEKAPPLSDAEKQQALGILSKLPDGNAVCHGDFHPDNIMLTERGPVIMDWMTAGSGAPAADVARTLLMLSFSELPDSVPGIMKSFFRIVRRMMKNAYIKEYVRLSRVAMADIEVWYVPLAAARLNERRPEREAQRLRALMKDKLNSR